MIRKFIITTLLTLASVVALAQDKQTTTSKPDSIIKKIPTQVVGNNAYEYSVSDKLQTSESVKARLYAYSPSKVELLKSSQQTTYFGLSVVGFGLSTVGATLEYIDNSGGGPADKTTAKYVLTGAAAAFVISSICHAISAKHHAHKALALYNERYQ